MTRLGAAAVSFQFLVGCATVAPKNVESQSAFEDRMVELGDQVESQTKTIAKLTAEIEAIRETAQAPKAPRHGAPSLPIVKLSPVASLDDDEVIEEDETIADSSHENLELYREALRLKAANRCEAAQRKLRDFIEENPSHVYADRAEYLVAECHFRDGEFVLASNAARELQVRYPHSLRVADALLLRAKSQLELGAARSAQVLFRSVLEKYPATPAAGEASRRLSELRLDKPTRTTRAPILLDELR